MNETNDDLFICGKCHRQFVELNNFLVHRSTCQTSKRAAEMNFSIYNLEPILDENCSNPSNEFDVLFSSPVDQFVFNTEICSPTIDSNVKSKLSEEIVSVECPVCDENFFEDQLLENHLFEHSFCIDDQTERSTEKNLSLQCQICTVNFTSNGSLILHKKMIHCLKPVFRCLNSQCSQLFDKPVDYIFHARVHNQKREKTRRTKTNLRCRICKRTFLTVEQLENHLEAEQHEFFCQICSIMFRCKNSYHNHLAHHQDRIPVYRCDFCEESFEKRLDLSKHRSTSHEKNLRKEKFCSTCKLTFKTSFHLNRHNITKHSDLKPFKCEQDGCQQAFARKDKLKQHAAKHTPDGGTFKCEICVKTFIRAEHLRDHKIVRHSRKFPFRCEYCRKGFLHPNQLYNHHKQYHKKKIEISSNENSIRSITSINSTSLLSTSNDQN